MNEAIEAWKRAQQKMDAIDKKTREVEQESWMLAKVVQNDQLNTQGNFRSKPFSMKKP